MCYVHKKLRIIQPAVATACTFFTDYTDAAIHSHVSCTQKCRLCLVAVGFRFVPVTCCFHISGSGALLLTLTISTRMNPAWQRDAHRPPRAMHGMVQHAPSYDAIGNRRVPPPPASLIQNGGCDNPGNPNYFAQHGCGGYGMSQSGPACNLFLQPPPPTSGHLRQEDELPPGTWAPSGLSHHFSHHERSDRSRSREPAPRTDEVARLLAQLPPGDFKKVFYSLPAGLRDVAYLAPDDVIYGHKINTGQGPMDGDVFTHQHSSS